MNTQNKRERLIESAAELFHHNGLGNTSLADIAKHAQIPIGNVYYYFKAKDDLAIAAIERRKDYFNAIYSKLDEVFPDPRQRLIEYLGYYNKMRDDYYTHGCPIGRIVNETNLDENIVTSAAANVFKEFLHWATEQFKALGHEDEPAKANALSMMAGIQGAVIMARSFSDPQIITHEMKRLEAWLESLPNRRISLGKAGIKASA